MVGHGAASEESPEARLLRELDSVRAELAAAEAELSRRMSDIYAFEARVETRLGSLTQQLAELESEIEAYLEQVKQIRYRQIFGSEQPEPPWKSRPSGERPPGPRSGFPSPPQEPETNASLRSLYRKLARQYHPDLAEDEADRRYRTAKMAEINDAYQARSLAGLKALLIGAKVDAATLRTPGSTSTQSRQMIALQEELTRTRRRLQEVKDQLLGLHLHPSVQLSLDVKLAWREDRDLLREMAKDLKQKIARKTAERDFLKAQVERSDPS